MLRKFLRNSSLLRLIAMLVTFSFVAAQTVQAQSPMTLRGGSQASRPAGGGGGDIIIFDVIDSVSRANRPAGGGGGGGDILVFDIVDSVLQASRVRGGGGVVPDFVLVNGVIRVMVLGESDFPGVYEVLVDMGDSMALGLMWEQPEWEVRGKLGLGIWF